MLILPNIWAFFKIFFNQNQRCHKMNKIKLFFLAALVGVLCLPKETEISVANKRGQRVALGMVGADKEPPTGAVSMSYFLGFFLTPAGVTVYLDLARGFCVATETKTVFNFTATKRSPNEYILEYANSDIKDIVTTGKDSSVVIIPTDKKRAQATYKRIK